MLILQMCDAHKSEVRCLRDRILELEKQTKEFKLLTHFNFAGLHDQPHLLQEKLKSQDDDVRELETVIQELEGQIDELSGSNT